MEVSIHYSILNVMSSQIYKYKIRYDGNADVAYTLNNAKEKIDKALKNYYEFNQSDLNRLYEKLDKRERDLIENLINELEIHTSSAYCSIGISDEFLFSIIKNNYGKRN